MISNDTQHDSFSYVAIEDGRILPPQGVVSIHKDDEAPEPSSAKDTSHGIQLMAINSRKTP
jgi:hypothetical protein